MFAPLAQGVTFPKASYRGRENLHTNLGAWEQAEMGEGRCWVWVGAD